MLEFTLEPKKTEISRADPLENPWTIREQSKERQINIKFQFSLAAAGTQE